MSVAMHPEFEAVIGLEIHCQLATDTKIFCGCRARLPDGKSVADVEPNSNSCEICAGHPGTLPVLNKRAVEYAVRAGLATGCRINARNVFARKNYFYPDLPKGYQISQLELPLCEEGRLEIETAAGGRREIRVQRIHMEEDAGKNVHATGYSVVNLNRAGVPLIEIVSAPEMHTPEEAGAYMRAMHAVVTYLGITDGNMQEGNFRCDANVSVRPRGTSTLGTRAEIKNVNSFRFVEKAIEFEIGRQIDLIKSGGRVVQETRLYDADKNQTFSMRSKEEAQDYRYFPDPDLIPVKLDPAWIEELRGKLPELPHQKRARYAADLGLSPGDAGVLTSTRALAEFFESVVAELTRSGTSPAAGAKPAANLISGEVIRLLNESGTEIGRMKLTSRHVADTVRLTLDKSISSTGAKSVIAAAWKTGEDVSAIVEREGLRQVSDAGALEPAVDAVIADHPAQVAEFRGGKDKMIGFFVGQVMKRTGGKANPGMIQDILRKKLSGGS